MENTISVIDKRLSALDKSFEQIKKQVVEAEQFIMKGKEQMVSISGAFKELTEVKKTLQVEKLVDKEVMSEVQSGQK